MRLRLTTELVGLATVMAATFVPYWANRGIGASIPAVEIHEELLAALDNADAQAVATLLSDRPFLYLLDPSSQPVTVSGAHLNRAQCGQSFVSLWNRDEDDPGPSKLLSATVVAESPSSSVVAFEFERPNHDHPRFRATSILVSERNTVRIRHLHISSATREDREE